jgi:peptidyl-prolyl cis-trans isomerase A (cyclophilin A)/peptidyl-prolyl cis-trans isomerase B (cyclophilin B)
MRLATFLLSALLVPQLAAAQDADPENAPERPPRVRVVTNAGAFVIELDPIRAPLTVRAFLKYVNEGFYNGLIFHRVVPGFIAQAGAYTPDMQPKPVTENVVNESGNGLSNLRGTVGFARSANPHSGTSQFYINLADNVDLNPRPTRWGYAVFGKVVEGMEVVDDIGHRPTAGGGPFDRNVPIDPVIIERIEVIE